jgi:hypothetical protein
MIACKGGFSFHFDCIHPRNERQSSFIQHIVTKPLVNHKEDEDPISHSLTLKVSQSSWNPTCQTNLALLSLTSGLMDSFTQCSTTGL